MTDLLDRTLQYSFLLVVIALPAIGYWLTVLDIRAYLRALRGALIRLTQPISRQSHLPDWVQDETPPCLRALGLTMPCSHDDLKEAYRQRAKELHPDRGGDVQRFLLLQTHMEQATHFLNQQGQS